MDFAKLIKEARKREGLNQSEAAAAWGVNLRTLQGWEIGRRKPTGENVIKLLPHILPK
jgi:DNA-binding transcriptional regulator YiaG